MTMTKDDKKWITDALVDFGEKVLFPKFDKLEGRMDKLEKKVEKLDAKVDGVEERLGRRIDKVAEAVTDTRTNHERRVRRLEKEVGLPSSPVAL